MHILFKIYLLKDRKLRVVFAKGIMVAVMTLNNDVCCVIDIVRQH